MTAPTPDTWTAVDGGTWHFAAWDDDAFTVFYNQGSGETLLLNALGGQVLRALRERAASVSELRETLAEADADALRAALQYFWQANLIRPVAR